MARIPRRLVADDETVVMALRPHWKKLVRPALVLLAVSPLATYAIAVVPAGDAQPAVRVAILASAALVVLRWCAWPFVRWLATSYVLTDRRLITRIGVVTRAGHDVPLSRVNDVTFEHRGILERLLRCGTLVVQWGEYGHLVLRHVPQVEHVQREIHELAEGEEQRRRDARADEQRQRARS